MILDPLYADLGGDDDLATLGPQRTTQHLFRVPPAIDGRRIEPADPVVQCGPHGGLGARIAAVFSPVLTTDGPAAHADDRQGQIGAGQGAGLHAGSHGDQY